MPYFPKYNLLFIHAPKNGGTSVENTLQQIQCAEQFNWAKSKERATHNNDTRWQRTNIYGFTMINRQEYALQHLTYEQMRLWNYLPRGSERMRVLFIARNPYSRIVSEYKWQLLFGYEKSFSEFVHEAFVGQWYRTNKFHQHLLPQVDFIRGLDIDRVHVVYFEHLKEAIADFFASLSAQFPEFANAELRRDNDSADLAAGSGVLERLARQPWQSFYSAENRQTQLEVLEMYREDFERFGYETSIDAQ